MILLRPSIMTASPVMSIRSDPPAGRWEDVMPAGNGMVGVTQLGRLAERDILRKDEFTRS